MTDLATLQIDVQSDGVRVAWINLDKLEKTAKKTERQAARTSQGVDKMNRSYQRLGRTLRNIKRLAVGGILGGLAGFGAVGASRATVDIERRFRSAERLLEQTSGSAILAAKEMKFLDDTADRLGVQVLTLADSYGKLFTAGTQAGMSTRELNELMEGTAAASVALALGPENVRRVFFAIQQIAAKGVVSMEELRQQLGEQIPNALQIMAQEMQKDVPTLLEEISSGSILAADGLRALSTGFNKFYGPAAQKASKEAPAQFARMENAIAKMARTLANSGLFDTLGEMAQLLTKVFDSQAFKDAIQVLGETIAKWAPVIVNNLPEIIASLSALISFYVTKVLPISDLLSLNPFGGKKKKGKVANDKKEVSEGIESWTALAAAAATYANVLDAINSVDLSKAVVPVDPTEFVQPLPIVPMLKEGSDGLKVVRHELDEIVGTQFKIAGAFGASNEAGERAIAQAQALVELKDAELEFWDHEVDLLANIIQQGDKLERQADARQAANTNIRDLQDELGILMRTNAGDEQDDLRTAIELKREYADATSAQVKEMLRLTKQVDELADHQQDVKRLSDSMGSALSSAFKDAVFEAENFKDVLSQVSQRLASLAFDFATQEAFSAIGSTFFSGLSSIFPFAQGGVVNGPTTFPMANGTGLMGEAGPEAIMPLTRDPSGNLAVSAVGGGASGGGNVVNINTNVVVEGGAGSASDGGEEQAAAIASAVELKVATIVDQRLMMQSRPGGLLNQRFGK